jgi:hypothetical protein
MNMWFDLSALMPGGKKSTARAATMLDILEGIHHVRDEAKHPCKTECNASPDAATVSALNSEYGAKQVLTELYFRRDSLCSSSRAVRKLGNQQVRLPLSSSVSVPHFEIAAVDLPSAVLGFA